MTKIQRIVCMALLLTGVVAASACFSINGIRNEAQDRAEIKQLMWRYARALDTGDAEAYAATFAPDGQFGRGDDATRGREELKKMIQDLQNNPVQGIVLAVIFFQVFAERIQIRNTKRINPKPVFRRAVNRLKNTKDD